DRLVARRLLDDVLVGAHRNSVGFLLRARADPPPSVFRARCRSSYLIIVGLKGFRGSLNGSTSLGDLSSISVYVRCSSLRRGPYSWSRCAARPLVRWTDIPPRRYTRPPQHRRCSAGGTTREIAPAPHREDEAGSPPERHRVTSSGRTVAPI